MTIEIPCNECICLAMCKSRTTIICDIIYNFMERHLSPSVSLEIGVDQFALNREQVWKQLGIQFRKQSEAVTIDKKNKSNGTYMISKKVTMTTIMPCAECLVLVMCKGKKVLHCPILFNYLHGRNNGTRLEQFTDLSVLGGITNCVFLKLHSSSKECKVQYVSVEYKVQEKYCVLFTTQELTIYEQ